MANVSYKISGKHDPKGINGAISSFQKLEKVTQSINNVFKGFVLVKVMQGLNSVVKGSTDNFLQQNQALQKFYTATKLSNNNLEKMISLRNDLSKGNFFDDDSLNNAMVLAEQMGLTEEQIENVMKAATDITASGIMPLDQAVKALGQTYSGTAGAIGKVAPELKNLSAEELKNGAAVDLMKQKYNGFAESMSNSFSGRNTQFKNTFSDLQAAIGSIIQGFKFIGQGTYLEPLNKITNWITENRDRIFAFVLSIPQMAKSVCMNVWEIVKATFTGEGIKNLFIFIGTVAINNITLAIKTTWEMIKALFDDILAIGDFTTGNLFRIINNKIMGVGNTLIETINTALSKILDSKAIKWLAENVFKTTGFDGSNVISFRFEEKQITTFQEFTSRIGNNTKTLVENYKTAMSSYADSQKNALLSFSDFYSDLNNNLVNDLSAIIDTMDIPDDLKIALGSVAKILPTIAEDLEDETENNNPETDSKTQNKNNWATDLLGKFGELGTYIKSAMDGGWQAVLVQFLGQVIEKVQELSPGFYLLINCVSSLLDSVIEKFLPVFDELAQSFLDNFGSLQAVISSLLEIISSAVLIVARIFTFLNSVISALAPAITSILNVLVIALDFFALIIDCLEPFMNVIIVIIKAIATVITVVANTVSNILTAIYNAVIAVYNFLVTKKNEKAYKDYKSLDSGISQIWNGFDNSGIDSLLAEAKKQMAISSNTGTAASYTAQRDLYVTINYNNSYINGDCRAIALNLRDEIKAAEKLGY